MPLLLKQFPLVDVFLIDRFQRCYKLIAIKKIVNKINEQIYFFPFIFISFHFETNAKTAYVLLKKNIVYNIVGRNLFKLIIKING